MTREILVRLLCENNGSWSCPDTECFSCLDCADRLMRNYENKVIENAITNWKESITMLEMIKERLDTCAAGECKKCRYFDKAKDYVGCQDRLIKDIAKYVNDLTEQMGDDGK